MRRFVASPLRLTAALLLSMSGAAAAAEDVPESQRILECVMDNMPPALRIADVVVETRGLDHEDDTPERIAFAAHIRERSGKLAIAAIVSAPEALRGTAYLFRQTDEGPQIHYYSPELDSVRRITGSRAGGGVFGSALTFSDFENIERTMRSSSITLRKGREADGSERRRMTVLPPPGSEAPFGRIDLLIDTERCFIVRAEARNREGETIRTLRIPDGALDYMNDAFWYPRRLIVENHDNERRSQAEIRSLSLPDSLPEARFSPESFFRAPD